MSIGNLQGKIEYAVSPRMIQPHILFCTEHLTLSSVSFLCIGHFALDTDALDTDLAFKLHHSLPLCPGKHQLGLFQKQNENEPQPLKSLRTEEKFTDFPDLCSIRLAMGTDTTGFPICELDGFNSWLFE